MSCLVMIFICIDSACNSFQKFLLSFSSSFHLRCSLVCFYRKINLRKQTDDKWHVNNLPHAVYFSFSPLFFFFHLFLYLKWIHLVGIWLTSMLLKSTLSNTKERNSFTFLYFYFLDIRSQFGYLFFFFLHILFVLLYSGRCFRLYNEIPKKLTTAFLWRDKWIT